MPVEVKLLSGSQFLLTTLVVKLAVVAALATMLVRFRQFRRILIPLLDAARGASA